MMMNELARNTGGKERSLCGPAKWGWINGEGVARSDSFTATVPHSLLQNGGRHDLSHTCRFEEVVTMVEVSVSVDSSVRKRTPDH